MKQKNTNKVNSNSNNVEDNFTDQINTLFSKNNNIIIDDKVNKDDPLTNTSINQNVNWGSMDNVMQKSFPKVDENTLIKDQVADNDTSMINSTSKLSDAHMNISDYNKPTTFGSFGTRQKHTKKEDISGWLGTADTTNTSDEFIIGFKQPANDITKDTMIDQIDNLTKQNKVQCIDADDDEDLQFIFKGARKQHYIQTKKNESILAKYNLDKKYNKIDVKDNNNQKDRDYRGNYKGNFNKDRQDKDHKENNTS